MPKLTGIDKSGFPIGKIISLSYSTTPPFGTLLCDGTSYLRTTYPALFTQIGVTWGSVDSTHFNVPDLRGVVSRGYIPSSLGGTVTGSISGNQATVTGHGFNHSGIPVQFTSGAPTGLSNTTTYWEIYVDVNTLSFATTQANALAGTAISISGSVGGVLVQWQAPDVADRVAVAPGGSTGANFATYEVDNFASHTHILPGGAGAVQNVNYVASSDRGTATYNPPTASTGGNETRSKNVTVNYAVAYI